jgi:SAM-dependent methyltransferase
MNDRDRAAYRERYVGRLRVHGHAPPTLGWANGRQEIRFAALTSFLPLDRVASVLDVGCGFGDLFAFLRERGFRGSYTGIDFVPELIEQGRRAYAEAELLVADLAEFDPGRRYDLVVASGVFNAKLLAEDNWAHLAAGLRKMWELCSRVAAADFLTSYVDYEREDLYYASPEQVFGFAKTLTRRVALSHHYLPFEFAVGLFRDDRLAEGARFCP